MNGRTIGAGLGAAGAAGAIGVAIYGGQYPTAQIYGPTICRNPGAGRKICLTYDDGPEPEVHADADGDPRALQRQGDVLLDRHVGRARA